MIIKLDLGGGVPRHANEAGATACAVFNPIIQSAVGIVRESAGLVSNIASLGIALFVNTRGAAPPRPRAISRAANVIAFPAVRRPDHQQ
jgi:hypothetical protein